VDYRSLPFRDDFENGSNYLRVEQSFESEETGFARAGAMTRASDQIERTRDRCGCVERPGLAYVFADSQPGTVVANFRQLSGGLSIGREQRGRRDSEWRNPLSVTSFS